MPEYLAPGVFVEEVSFRAKSIEGVSTTTTGFIGPTRYGPLSVEPELITGLVDYERVYGDGGAAGLRQRGASPQHNFMWHAARAFFENGGKRLYVQRVFEAAGGATTHRAAVPTGPAARGLTIESRFPGASSPRRVRITPRGRPERAVGPARARRTGAALPLGAGGLAAARPRHREGSPTAGPSGRCCTPSPTGTSSQVAPAGHRRCRLLPGALGRDGGRAGTLDARERPARTVDVDAT